MTEWHRQMIARLEGEIVLMTAQRDAARVQVTQLRKELEAWQETARAEREARERTEAMRDDGATVRPRA